MVFVDLIFNGSICWAPKPSDPRYINTVLASVLCNFHKRKVVILHLTLIIIVLTLDLSI